MSENIGTFTSGNTQHVIYADKRKRSKTTYKKDKDGFLVGKAVNAKKGINENFFNEQSMDYYKSICKEDGRFPVVKDWDAFINLFRQMFEGRAQTNYEKAHKVLKEGKGIPLGCVSFAFYLAADETGKTFRFPSPQEKERWNELWTDGAEFHQLSHRFKLEPNPNFIHSMSLQQPLLALCWILPTDLM